MRTVAIAAALAAFALNACTNGGGPPLSGRSSGIAGRASSSSVLLYISDLESFDVFIYRLPALKLVGKLTGFFEPEGECSDANGNIWIANTGYQQMLEFKPGDRKPIATLSDPLGYPGSCAIDARTGNLAVTNVWGNSGTGNLIVFPHAGGTPTVYVNPSQSAYYFDGYDAAGNLYVDGKGGKGVYSLSVLARGKKKLATVRVNGGTIYAPGSVLWNGSTLVLGDQQCKNTKTSCLYQATVSGTSVSLGSEIPLSGSCDVAQVALYSNQLYGGNYAYCTKGKGSTDTWAYPAGGKPLDSVGGVHQPLGAAISNG